MSTRILPSNTSGFGDLPAPAPFKPLPSLGSIYHQLAAVDVLLPPIPVGETRQEVIWTESTSDSTTGSKTSVQTRPFQMSRYDISYISAPVTLPSSPRTVTAVLSCDPLMSAETILVQKAYLLSQSDESPPVWTEIPSSTYGRFPNPESPTRLTIHEQGSLPIPAGSYTVAGRWVAFLPEQGEQWQGKKLDGPIWIRFSGESSMDATVEFYTVNDSVASHS